MSQSVDDFFAELESMSTQSLNQRMDSFMSQRDSSRAASSADSSRPPTAPVSRDHSTASRHRSMHATASAAPAARSSTAPCVQVADTTRTGRAHVKRSREEEARVTPAPCVAPAAPFALPAAFAETTTMWSCAVCTLDNPPTAAKCEACDTSRGGGAVGQSVNWPCRVCGFLNPPADRCCQCASGRYAPAPEATRQVLMLDDEPMEANPDSASHGLDDGDMNEEEEDLDNAEALEPGDEEFSDDEEDDLEEEEEEEEEEDDATGTQLQLAAAVRGARSTRGSDALRGERDKELVAFLSQVTTVPFETLPLAMCPPSMIRNSPLKPFQLQGLHWMLQREGHLGAGSTPPAHPSTSGSRGDDDWSRLLFDDTAELSRRQQRTGDAVAQGLDFPLPTGAGGSDATTNGFYYSGGLLSDYMGLGKTRMLIALCESAKAPKADRLQFNRVASSATIIVCPMSLMSQWFREITTCVVPAPRVLKYYGACRKHKSIFEIAQSYDYVLTSFQTLSREPPDGAIPPSKLRMIHWHRAIVDEAHYIRNRKSTQSRAVTGTLDSRFRWVVTATPLQNRLADLFPLLHFLRVPHFRELEWWNAEIERPLLANPDDARSIAALQLLFSSLLLRRLPTSTVNGMPILQLPPKEVRVVRVALTKDEKEFYDAVHQNGAARVRAAGRHTGSNALRQYSTAFEMLIRCRQCCLHPFIVVRALMEKAERQGLDASSYLPPAARTDGGGTEADLHRFLEGMKKKLLAESAFVKSALDAVADQAQLKATECVICFDAMVKPVMLPCAHMFCEACINNALPSTGNRCPLCKRLTKRTELALVPEVTPSSKTSIIASLETATLNDHTTWALSSKAKAILDIIQATGEDEKVVVFSHFTTFLKYFATVLDAHKVTFCLFTGELSANKRDDIVQRFSRRSKPKVLLATITACGVGINLTRASQCVIADPSWNPGMEEQAMNRIHRIGQERPVVVTRLLSPGTVDDDIDKLAEHKRGLTEYCFGGRGLSAGRQGGGRLGKVELLAMFSRAAPVEAVPLLSTGPELNTPAS